jgi:hypothetical protein
MALEGYEEYAAYRDFVPKPEVHTPPTGDLIVEILKAARKRIIPEK